MRLIFLCLLLITTLLTACGSPLQAAQPIAAPESTAVASTAQPTARPTPNLTLIDRPILDDRPLKPHASSPAQPLPPTVQPTVQPTAQHHSTTARLVINEIGLDLQLDPVGLDAAEMPIVPKHDAGWFTESGAPGQGENIVLWGHALRFRDSPDIPAPFGRLSALKPGAPIALYDDEGIAHSYVVTQQIFATPDQVEYILPKGKEIVTMVSCIGDEVLASDGSVVNMTHRLITIAEPTS